MKCCAYNHTAGSSLTRSACCDRPPTLCLLYTGTLEPDIHCDTRNWLFLFAT